MSFSDLKLQIYTYLGFRGVKADERTDECIIECLSELDEIGHFRHTHRVFDTPPEFLLKEPYETLLKGCRGVILCAMTLGAEVDKRIKYLSRTDMAKSVVFDATASAYLEYKSDEHEKMLGNNLTYRFCPGYGGSSVDDLKYIFQLIKPEKIGITLGENMFMLPEKSMAGIIGIGKKAEKSCAGCFMLEHCQYLKEGVKCYASEKK